jgi:iron complex outermembrane recepter protein
VTNISSCPFSTPRDGDSTLYQGQGKLAAAANVLFACVNRLEHEYILRADLDTAWAACPIEPSRDCNLLALVLEHPGAAVLDRLLGRRVGIREFLRIAISPARVLRQAHARGLIYRRVKRCAGTICLIAPCVIATLSPAIAQTQGTSINSEDNELAEIVVTVQKRSENIQDAPLSVTAFTGSTLTAAGVTVVSDLGEVDSTLQFSAIGGIATVFMRGLGNPVATAGNEASVPMYIDDVYYSRLSPSFFDLVNVNDVEILKGPQGTLFGRNASAGVLSIYTRDPGNTPVIEGVVGYGNYATTIAQLYASMPVTDQLAADISLSEYDQASGWGRNVYNGDQTDLNRSFTARSKIIWKPTDSTTVKFIGYYVEQNSEQGELTTPYAGTVGGGVDTYGTITVPPVRPQPRFYDVDLDQMPGVTNHTYGGSIRLDQELGIGDFSNISAARKTNETLYEDGDLTPFPLSVVSALPVDQQYSEELQLKSKPGAAVSWIGGFFYLNTLGGYDPIHIHGDTYIAQGINSINLIGEQRLNSFAPYGQVTYPLWRDTNLTAGLRYNKDDLRGFGSTTIYPSPGGPLSGLGPSFLAAPPFDQTRDFEKLTYKVSLDHHFNPNVMAYALVSTGYKSGTYNTVSISSGALNPETVTTYEFGLKTELLDHRLRLDGAVFRNNLKDPQVQSSQMGIETVINAGSARSQGVEIESTAILAQGLTARLSATYLQAEFLDFSDAPYFYQRPGGGNNLGSINARGNALPRAPRESLDAGLDYVVDVSSLGKFAFDANLAYSSKFYWDSDNVISEGPLTIVNASAAFTPRHAEALSIRLWVKNLTNKEYYSIEYEEQGPAGFAASPAAPRTFGGEFRFKF